MFDVDLTYNTTMLNIVRTPVGCVHACFLRGGFDYVFINYDFINTLDVLLKHILPEGQISSFIYEIQSYV